MLFNFWTQKKFICIIRSTAITEVVDIIINIIIIYTNLMHALAGLAALLNFFHTIFNFIISIGASMLGSLLGGIGTVYIVETAHEC